MNDILKVANSQERAYVVPRGKRGVTTFLWGMLIMPLTLFCIYITFRGAAFLHPGYRIIDRVFAILLLGAEFFSLFHGLGYLLTMFRATKSYNVAKTNIFSPISAPPVAVIIASFNEDPLLLEDTVISAANLDYANKHIYLLDDSTNAESQKGAQALAKSCGIACVHRINRRGFKAGAVNDLLKELKEKYLAIFDADQKPFPNFLKEVIPLLEADERLAFVQTPQYYANAENSAVARGAAYQQAVFYEYICEGKSTSNAMFCCGTNVVLRAEALRCVGGFDEASVTEDFATSFRLHLSGWKSLYYNKVAVKGLGPETLAGFFVQQTRWAMGNIGIFKKIISLLLHHPRALSPIQWWEYLLSSSYYFIGWVNLCLLISPITYILFGIRPLIANPLVYFAAFVPYFLVSLYIFYLSMGFRGYRVSGLLQGQSIGFISFWVFITSSIVALLGRRRPFGVTPKGARGRLPFLYLTPQLLMLALSLIALVMGSYQLLVTHDYTMIVNIFWVTYHSLLLATVFYFNRSFHGYPDTHIFRDWASSPA